MAVFVYRGLVAATGKQVRGVRDADNPKVLRTLLKREGVLLTRAVADEKAAKGTTSRSLDIGSMFRRIGAADVAMMTRQLATLVMAGIPLVEAVSAIVEQSEKLELQRVLTQVRDALNEGSSLAKAFEAHPKVFTNLYVNMVAAGEASGTLELVLERLADFFENQSKLKGKVVAALAYPALMSVIGVLLIGMMMVVVVPKVTSIFESLDRALPWYTSLLIAVSNGIASNQALGFALSLVTLNTVLRAKRARKGTGKTRSIEEIVWLVVALVAVTCFLLGGVMVESLLAYLLGGIFGGLAGFGIGKFFTFLATPKGRLWKDGRLLRLPVFGSLFSMLAVARFSRTLATLLKSGVPLLKAMDIVKNVLDNAKLEKVIEEATGSIREGESIAGPLKRSKDFPKIVTHMIAVGEKSGQLEAMLENVARAYDAQVETRVQAMTSLLEPAMILVMGGAVAFIAFAILMPLIQMNDFVQ